MPHIRANSSRLRTPRVENRPSKKTRKIEESRAWKIVNSSFFLWLLSSLALSFGTWKYNQIREEEKRLSEKAEKIVRIDQEIRFRMGADGNSVNELSELVADRSVVALSKEQYDKVVSQILLPPTSDRVMFPEYSQRGLLSLMYEEMWLVGNPDEERCLLMATMFINELRKPYKMLQSPQGLKIMITTIANYRWTNDALRATAQQIQVNAENKKKGLSLPLKACGSVTF